MKPFKPTKVKFSPMPVKEEETILRYLHGWYVGPWKQWFDRHFIEFIVINRNRAAMTVQLRHLPYYRVARCYDEIDQECIRAVEIATPYLHSKQATD